MFLKNYLTFNSLSFIIGKSFIGIGIRSNKGILMVHFKSFLNNS